MGFFSNPGKAFKGFCKDPVGRISKVRDGDCTPKGHAQACGSGGNVGAVAGAAGGMLVGGATGALRGAVTGAAAGCVKGVADYHSVCATKPYKP